MEIQQEQRLFSALQSSDMTLKRAKQAARRRLVQGRPARWIDFLDKTEIDWTVVYPTAGLAVGRIIAEDWAIAACRALQIMAL